MKIGKLLIAWDHEKELLHSVEMGARARIRDSLSDARHPWTRTMVARVLLAAEKDLKDRMSGLIEEATHSVAGNVLKEITTKGSPLRDLTAMLLRSELRSLLEEHAENARTAAEAANPCVDGYTEHNYGEAGMTSCERCGQAPPAAPAAAAPRTPTEQIGSAVLASEGLRASNFVIRNAGSSEIDA